MKKVVLFSVIALIVSGAGLFAYFITNGNQRLRPWVRFKIQRDLEHCGSTTKEKKCVVEGYDGWLYLQESLLTLTLPWTDNTPSVIGFKDSLRARGITLLVVPVPDKLQVESSHYLRFDENLIPGNYSRWVKKLRKAGVLVVDELNTFHTLRDSLPLFDPYESHCTTAGRKIIAKAVARTLKDNGLHFPGKTHAVKDTLVNGSGNLYYLKRDRYASYKVHQSMVLNADGSRFRGSRKAPIVILGDSNAGQGRGYSSDVGSLITQATGTETYTISKVGAGNSGPRLFKGKAKFLEGKKVIVWVFDGRELYGRIAAPAF